MRLSDKTAIITSAGSTIGRAIALRFAGEGANTILCDYQGDKVAQTARVVEELGKEPLVIVSHISQKQAAEDIFTKSLKAFGQVHILINDFNLRSKDAMAQITEEKWDEVLDNNLKNAFLMTQAATPHMVAKKRGKIVNVSSMSYRGVCNSAHYVAAKTGLLGLTRATAFELAQHNITVNSIAVGQIETESVRTLSAKEQKKLVSSIPALRLGQPVDVANVALFLASDESSFVTGQTIECAGGASI
ncbi:SDR family NAD(P)-dependent oxidoreductase [Candidatus Hydrogenedentota bacterium]